MKMERKEVDRFYKALRDPNLATMETLLKEYLDAEAPPVVILNEGLIGAMAILGQEFKAGQVWVPEVLLAARNMNRGIEILKPELVKGNIQSRGKIVIGTVKGDIHDIGKDLVVGMLRAGGFDVIDLGVDVPSEKFIDAVKTSGAKVVGLSGLITLSFDSMKETIAALEAAGLRSKVKVMVGGGSLTEKVREYVGADALGSDAQAAVSLANQWL